MKRILAFLVVLMVMCLLISGAHAAGTVTVSPYYTSADGKVLVLKVACVGDAANGSVPNTLITDAVAGTISGYTKQGWYLFEVMVVTGSVKPDAADVYLIDSASGNTIFSQANLIPTSGTAYGTISAYRAVTSGVSVVVTNQSTASATYIIYITLAR